MELAHWFYIDEYVSDKNNRVRQCNMREFSEHMFRHVSFLRRHANDLDDILERWREYKIAVPTYGAILLNSSLTKVLLVQSYSNRSSWGLPKGKVNQEEAPAACAVREVLEEVGFDISDRIDPNNFLQAVIMDQTVWLYPIPGVPDDTLFAPRTKCEIRDIRWFPVADLPNSRKEAPRPNELNVTASNLFMVMPFVK